MVTTLRATLVFACAGLLFVSAPAAAAPILFDGQTGGVDNFFLDPEVSPAGASASFVEGLFFSVIAANDPALGDPVLFTPAVGLELSFDFNFTEGAGEADEFRVFLIDPVTGNPLTGLDFSTTATSSGTVTFDTTPIAGLADVGIQFELNSLLGDTGTGSTAQVTNLDAEVIPEPGTWALLLGGLAAFGVLRHRRGRA